MGEPVKVGKSAKADVEGVEEGGWSYVRAARIDCWVFGREFPRILPRKNVF